jgi:hypothetical protein
MGDKVKRRVDSYFEKKRKGGLANEGVDRVNKIPFLQIVLKCIKEYS